MVEPKYWGTVKGQILNAIVNEFCDIEDAIMYETHLPMEIIKQAIKELMQTGELSYTDEETLWVQYDLYKSYENFELDSLEKEMNSKIPMLMDTKKLDIIEWIYQWKEESDKTIPMGAGHFYLEGELLTDFTNGLLKFAGESVVVVNPFVDVCSTTRILSLLPTYGVDVQIVTRSPETDFKEYSRKRKTAWHESMVENGVTLLYNNNIHAKMMLIDGVVGIASSMNLIGTSVGSQSWESGMVTFDQGIVELIKKSLSRLVSSRLTKKLIQ